MGASLAILPPKSQVKLSRVCVHTSASGAASWGWRGTTMLGNDVSGVLDVPAQMLRNASGCGLFSLGAEQPSLYWLWGHPSRVCSPGWSAQSVPARKNKASLPPSPFAITPHPSFPGPGETGGFLTQHVGHPVSPNRSSLWALPSPLSS